MVENLEKIVLGIIKDEKALKEFEKLKTVKEVYEKCKELGYEGNYEEFEKDYYQIVYRLNQELSPEDLEAVSGGGKVSSFFKNHPNLTMGLTVAPCAGALMATGFFLSKLSDALAEHL